MTEYLAPAVFLTEIPFGAHPIEGVATSAAEFLAAGIADRPSEILSNDQAPDWAAQNQHDPGTTRLELSSWVAESLAFRSDPLPLHAVAATAPQATAQPPRQDRAQTDRHASGAPSGASSEPEPNREFADLWLRFVSGVAQLGQQDSPGREVGRVDLSRVVSKYIGETEKNLGAVLTHADQSGAALQFDEADALLGKRTDVRDSHDRYASQEANDLLQQTESREGATILTTKPGDEIDPDVLKRLQAEVAFPIPPRPGGRVG